jgi:hypothetical protein
MNFAAPFSVSDNAGATRTDISLAAATSSTNGYLTAADWTNFNNKQPGGNYLLDPGANGFVFRTALNTTRAATSADLSTLLQHIYYNGAGTGIGPLTFVPPTSATLQVYDATATSGITALNLQAGPGQNTNPIMRVTDGSGALLAQLAWSNLYPYWLMNAPANITDFGSLGVQATGDATPRLKVGLDQGSPMIVFGGGVSTFDVGLIRLSPNNLQITNGSGTTFKGSLWLQDLHIAGTCTGCGSSTAITQLTGDVAAGPGPGSVASTLATVNTTPGACGDATHVCRVTTNGKGLVTAQSAVTVSGGGGAALITQLLDFAPGTITATSIPFGAACNSTTPCYVNMGGTQFAFPTGTTLNLTAGTASDTIYYYVDASGSRTMGYNSANTYTCTNCEAIPVNGISAFPSTSFPLYQCTVTAGAFTTCVDARPILAESLLQNGLGTRITQTGTIKQIDLAENARSVTGTSDSLSNNDCGGYVRYSNTNPVAVAIPQAGLSSQFRNGCAIEVRNNGAGTVTFTPSGSTISGASTFALTTGSGQRIVSDGTNYQLGAGGGGGGATAPLTLSSTAPQLILADPANLLTSLQFAGASGAWSLQQNGTSAANQKIYFKNHVTNNNTLLLDPSNDTTNAINLTTINFQTGSIATGLRRVTANDTATLQDGTVLCDATSASITETLPASAANGDKIIVKRVDASGNNVTLAPQAGTTIEGNASVNLTRGTALELQFESATNTWWII